MTGLKQRLDDLRSRRPVVDHALQTQEHYGKVQASQQAGAVTYFGFLSFFPVLALAVFVVGWVSRVYPDAQDQLASAIDQVIPGLVGSETGQISLDDVQRFSGLAGIVGLLGVLYSGLGWLDATRTSLQVVFDVPPRERPSFVTAKLWDLLGLVAIGLVLFVSVIAGGAITGFSGDVLDWLGLDKGLSWLLYVLTRLVGWGINTVLFFVLFRLVGHVQVPARSLWVASAIGGFAFEILKAISLLLFHLARGNPAFQAFGVALVLLLWINYFARVVLYAAAWAYTSPAARELRLTEHHAPPVQGPRTPALAVAGAPGVVQASPDGGRTVPVGSFLAGAGTMVAALGLLKKVGRK
jgi:membrane protein